MDLNLLKTFVKVADCGSLTKASKLLKHPKSKISRDLVKLENELEQSLLKRSPKGVTLTEQGYKLLQSVRDQLDCLESSIEKIKADKNLIQGRIKLTAAEDLSHVFLTRLIAEFIDKFPSISVELYSTSEFLDFKRHNIDLALRIGKLSDSTLVQKKLTDIDVIYVATKYFSRSNPKITDINDLYNAPIALIQNIHGVPLNTKILKNIQPVFASNSMSTLKDFVKSNKGIATLPKFLCHDELRNKEFEQILPEEKYISRSLYLLSAQSHYVPKHVKLFKDFIIKYIKDEIK